MGISGWGGSPGTDCPFLAVTQYRTCCIGSGWDFWSREKRVLKGEKGWGRGQLKGSSREWALSRDLGCDMEPVTEWIRHRFPSVRNLGPDALEKLLREERARPLLLDVRTPAEYEVSHLEGAIRIDPKTTDVEKVVKELGLAGNPKDIEVVCYCTAGYHGSEMAQKLQQALAPGPAQAGHDCPVVYNLEGGLAKWANERRPIVDSREQPTHLVHPYNKVWAELVEPEFRAPI